MVPHVVKYIKELYIPINGDLNKIKNVATIAANNDEEIGDIIANAMELAGVNGVISVEESVNETTSVINVEGIEIDKGYYSPYFINNNIKTTCDFEKPYVLIYNKKVTNFREIYPALEIANKKQKPIIVLAEDFESEIVNTLIANTLQGSLKSCAIRLPGFGTTRT